jgi:hypothetical protein
MGILVVQKLNHQCFGKIFKKSSVIFPHIFVGFLIEKWVHLRVTEGEGGSIRLEKVSFFYII